MAMVTSVIDIIPVPKNLVRLEYFVFCLFQLNWKLLVNAKECCTALCFYLTTVRTIL